MSINSVSRTLLPYYGPSAAANSSLTARSAAVSQEIPGSTASRVTAAPAASSHSELESTLEAALRKSRIATGTSTDRERNAGNGRHAPAIGLYQRVSQYSDDTLSVSGLMKSWNDIVRENQFEDAGVVGYVKAVAQNDAVATPSRVLHLTV